MNDEEDNVHLQILNLMMEHGVLITNTNINGDATEE